MKTESLSYGELLDLQSELKSGTSLHQQLALEAVNAALELRERHQDSASAIQAIEDAEFRADTAEDDLRRIEKEESASTQELAEAEDEIERQEKRIAELEAQLAAK